MPGFSVDPGSLRSAGNGFLSQQSAMSAALSQLRASLPGLGMCGGDDAGHAFAAKYGPQVEQLEKVVGDMAVGLGKMGQALKTMADNYEAADQASQTSGG